MATDIENQGATFSTTDIKLHVLVITLLTQDNKKLLKQLKSGFEKSINWNKYQSKISTVSPNGYLDYSVDPGFQGGKILFA